MPELGAGAWIALEPICTHAALVQNVSYRKISLRNWFEIRRLLGHTGFSRWQIVLPVITSEHTARLPAWARVAEPVYHAIKDYPLTKWLVYLFGPLFHVICIKEESAGGNPESDGMRSERFDSRVGNSSGN